MSRSKPTPASWRSVAGARTDVAGILRLGRIVEPIALGQDWDHWSETNYDQPFDLTIFS